MAVQSPFQWRRGPRNSFDLPRVPGVYALFLKPGSSLPGIDAGPEGLLYIGKAENQNGLRGRCHFNSQARNHAPRRTLAVILMDGLELVPVRTSVGKWGLDRRSDSDLSAWMHKHLHLAFETCAAPSLRESELLRRYAPPLNLTGCGKTDQHRRLSSLHDMVRNGLTAGHTGSTAFKSRLASASSSSTVCDAEPSFSAKHLAGAELDTAISIARRYGLDPKSYRGRLRQEIAWYRKPQDWTFPVNSPQWNDMIAVAEGMS